MLRHWSAWRLAWPMRPPSMSGRCISVAAFAALTLPPSRMGRSPADPSPNRLLSRARISAATSWAGVTAEGAGGSCYYWGDRSQARGLTTPRSWLIVNHGEDMTVSDYQGLGVQLGWATYPNPPTALRSSGSAVNLRVGRVDDYSGGKWDVRH